MENEKSTRKSTDHKHRNHHRSSKHRHREEDDNDDHRRSRRENSIEEHNHHHSRSRREKSVDDDHRRRHRYEDTDDDDDHRRSRREKSIEENLNHHSRSRREKSIDDDYRHRHRHEDTDEDDDHRRSRREKSIEENHHHHSRSRREKSIDGDHRHRRYDETEEDNDLKRERGESKKRKERIESDEERVDDVKRVRVSEGKKERRRLEDADEKRENRKLEDEDDDGKYKDNGNEKNSEQFDSCNNGRKRERRRFEDGDVKSASLPNDGAVESLNASSMFASETNSSNSHIATKVSSIFTTNENKGVNITGSHEVTAKSSTDGTLSTAGKIGNLSSRDALAKAKKAMQKHKELAEKLKKLPLLNKVASSSNAVCSEEGNGTTSVARLQATTSTTAGVVAASTFPGTAAASGMPVGMIDPAKYEAVKRAQELAAKMGFRQDAEFGPVLNFFPGHTPPDVAALQKPVKAPVLRLDALGREIDEHGNLVNISKPSNLSTLKVNINKQKKDAFQIYKPELEVDPEKNPHFDPRMGIDKNKLLRPKRMTFQFVEEGKWSKDAELVKLKSQFGEAQAKELKAKQAQLAKAKAEPNINPNLIEVSERVVMKEKQKEPIPEVEWWDAPLLRSGNYADITSDNPFEDKVKMEKITIYVEHPRPIEPPAEPAPPKPQPLKLTKKEQKKLRTQRRLAKEKERQEMIRQGLLEPPKPKVKMSNLMKVLGAEATQDPTKLEMEIRAAAAEREQAHVDRNIARKLTPSERREKKERKLFEDPNTLETIVSVYKINDLSHPQNRFKVDINAQENRLTGCAVISEGFSVVVVEGGSKSIKRYGKLMLRRINWAAKLENEDEDEDDDEEKPANRCVLVWQGSVAKPSFSRFSVHDKRTEAAARKIFSDNGVGHYWDLAANFVDDQL